MHGTLCWDLLAQYCLNIINDGKILQVTQIK
jgi:hypothetical protein